MFYQLALAGLLISACALEIPAAQPFLRVVTSQESGTNLLLNGDFEQGSTTSVSYWNPASQGYRLAVGEGRAGSRAVLCEKTNQTGWYGVSQTLSLNRTSTAPLVVRGWSKAENVSGSSDSDYSLYVDIIYQDNTSLWGRTGNFTTGTHDWNERVFTILPEKPVRSLSLYCLFRGQHTGRVWFDDLSVQEVAASGDAVLFQGTPMLLVSDTNSPLPETTHVQTEDGLRLGLVGQQVVSVKIDGQELAAPALGGFMARDVATNSDVFGFTGGACPELGLQLNATVTAQSNHLVVQGRLTSTRGVDRAVILLYALPVDASGWQWGDDIRRHRNISGKSEFLNADWADAGSTSSLSRYPVGAIYNSQAGLAVALDMGAPALFRLVYHAGTKQLFIAYDFGLVPETTRFPLSADFRFVLYKFDPQWGFRAAWEKLTGIFPAYFTVRSRQQGLWMPFTDVSTVQGWQDFGFRYHEGNNNVPFDDANGILSFRYTEPSTWWMSMPASSPRTEAEALRLRDAYAAGSPGPNQLMATATIAAGMQDAEGHAQLQFQNTPWTDGAVWSLNPNPNLAAATNGANIYWNETIKTQLYGPGANGTLDGEYLDSLEGYVTAELNFRRDHFRDSTVPLTFSASTFQPLLHKGLEIYEFTRWISDDVHGMGKLMFANSVPFRFGFLCPWVDVMGTETDWMPGGHYQPVADAQMCQWRTLSGQKPYLLLMNTDYAQFTSPFVEKYFQRCLAYGLFPSMFSHNASDNPYWQNPTWYNRDRPLFIKYIPLVRRVAEAGWMPVTRATCTPAGIMVERFGATTNGTVYFTLFNPATSAQTATLQLEPGVAGDPSKAIAMELLSTSRLPLATNGWTVTLGAESVAVVRVEAGPKLSRINQEPSSQIQLTIEAPADLEHVLETSSNLSVWVPVRTNPPQSTAFTKEETLPAAEAEGYFRLRW